MNKKGQVFEQIGGLATAVLVLALVLVISLVFMTQTKENLVDSITTTSYVNASKTLTNATTTIFAECIPDEDIAVTTIYNTTVSADAVALDPANYSVSGNRVTMTVLGIDYAAATKATYSCRSADLAYNSTSMLQTETFNITSWVSLIVVIVVGLLVLGLVRKLREE
jgi:hypothetical protein